MDKISIIMPAYNSSGTIADSIQSVVGQSYKNWELIVVDDCSEDGTSDIVKEIINKNKSIDIKLCRNPENKGVAYSRIFGINAANGSWIAFLDSDDLWTPDKLEKQMTLASKSESGSADGRAFLYTGSGFINERNEELGYTLHVPEVITGRELLKQNIISCSSVLLRKDLIRKYPFPITDKPIHEDFAVWISILKDIPCAYGIDEPLLIYRVSSSSKSSRKSKAALMNWNTYRFVGMGYLESIYYMMFYAVRGLRKWSKIRAVNSRNDKK